MYRSEQWTLWRLQRYLHKTHRWIGWSQIYGRWGKPCMAKRCSALSLRRTVDDLHVSLHKGFKIRLAGWYINLVSRLWAFGGNISGGGPLLEILDLFHEYFGSTPTFSHFWRLLWKTRPALSAKHADNWIYIIGIGVIMQMLIWRYCIRT